MERKPQTIKSISKLLSRVKFKFFDSDFRFILAPKGDGFLIQVVAVIGCVESKEKMEQKGGKHYISQHCTDSEIIFKTFKACKDFVNHELHEAFYVDNVRIFDPHLDLDALIDSVKHMKRVSRDATWYPPRIMENV